MRSTIALLCLALAAPLAAQTKQDYPGVTNFTRVDATVACGGATEVSTLDALKKDGFKTVINLRVATEPGVKLVGDITYIRTWEGWVYLATVLDCFSKKACASRPTI